MSLSIIVIIESNVSNVKVVGSRIFNIYTKDVFILWCNKDIL